MINETKRNKKNTNRTWVCWKCGCEYFHIFSPQHLQRRISWTKTFMKLCSMLNFNKFQGLKAEASPSEEAHKFCEWPIFPLVHIGTNHYSPNEINEIRECSFYNGSVIGNSSGDPRQKIHGAGYLQICHKNQPKSDHEYVDKYMICDTWIRMGTNV